MTKFIQNLINRLKALKTGMTNNSTLWTGQPVTTTNVQDAIDALELKDGEIEAAKDAYHEKQAEGRSEVTAQKPIADQVEDLARGLHNATPEKLQEYDIKVRKEPEPKDPPGQAAIDSIKDDFDGIGFLITLKPLVGATDFEIRRAKTAATFSGTPADSEFEVIKTTKKLTYVDDDIIPGERYHYRVVGFNHKGYGTPSPSQSAVQ